MSADKPRSRKGPEPPAPPDARWREMVLQSPFSTLVFDPSGRLLEVNRAFEEMWGVSAADVAGYNPFEDEQSREQGMLPLLERAFAGETLVLPEAPYDAAQTVSRGNRRWIRTFAYPVKDEEGRVTEVVFMHEDVTARREAEEERVSHGEAIEGERRRLLDIVGTVPGVVWEAWGQPDASAQRIDFVSDHVEQMLGYTRQEWLSTPNFWLTIVHPEDKEQAARSAAEHFARGGAGVNRFRWVAKDGRVLHVESHSTVMRDGQGRPSGMRGVTLDVSDRRRAEESLRESESRYQRAAEAGRVGVWDLDLETNELYLSPDLKALLGYADAELRNHFDDWCRLVHPDDRQKALSAAAAHVEGRTPRYEVEVRRRHREGHYLWFLAQGVVLKDAAGKAHRLTGSDTDITERKQAEERLRYQLHLTATITAKAGEALFLLDAEGRTTFMNPAAVEMFGWAEEDMLGRTLHDVIHYQRPDGSPLSMSSCPLGRVMTSGEGVHGHEDVFYARGGRSVFVRCSNAPVFEGERIVGAVLVVSDITRRKLAEEERERLLRREQAARAQAEEAGRLKDEFLATVSHELRTPLTAILGWAHLLEADGPDAETLRHAVAVIRRNAEQQRQLIEDILDVSRIITGKLNIETGRVEVSPIVLAAVETVQPAAEAKGVRLLTDLGPGAEVAGDPNRLQQVVWNLLANAVKFTPAGGEVKVRVERLQGRVRVVVSDTGQGIAPEFLPHVFERFRQADGSTTRQHSGLGLGLSIVRHLVELHGGSVRASSAGVGLGSTFTVELPLPVAAEDASGRSAAGPVEVARATPDASASAAGAVQEVPPPLVGLRVLLVDDDGDSLELLSLALRRAGAAVTAASSAEEALEALADARPDVIISDVGMPKVDGYELVRRVRTLAPEAGGLTPAVALTAYASETDRARALGAGFQAHMSKPVEPEALVEAVVSVAAGAGAEASE